MEGGSEYGRKKRSSSETVEEGIGTEEKGKIRERRVL
jgi:hypothetical protein